MPARDIYHNNVIHALEKEQWIVTHDPLHLKWGAKDMYIDIGAEKLILAEKASEKIGVEVKSFLGHSQMQDLEQAVGQYIIYEDVLRQLQPERKLYLAISEEIWSDVFAEPIGQLLIASRKIQLLVFDTNNEVITQWIP